MRRILITGGLGFIGSALIRHIIDNTNDFVINVDKVTYAANFKSIGSRSQSERYCFEHADICDREAIDSIFGKHRPSCIMNLAAESHVDRSIDSPRLFVTTNICGTFNLLERAREYYCKLDHKLKKDFKFHHISSDEVYGDLKNTEPPFTELNSYCPSSPYSASKASSDHLVRAWGRTYGLPTLITNCSNNFGPFHFPEKFIPHIVLNALSGASLPVYGDGSQRRDWLYVEDHALALFKVLSEGRVGETYNIGGNNEKKNIEVVEAICELLEELAPKKPSGVRKYRDLIVFVPDRPGHDKRYAINFNKIQRSLGWTPKETFESGLRKTVQWYIDNEIWWREILSGDYKLRRIGEI